MKIAAHMALNNLKKRHCDRYALYQENINREAKINNWICSIKVMILQLQRTINTLMIIKEIGNCVGKTKSFNRSHSVLSFITPMKSILKWCTVCYCINTVI